VPETKPSAKGRKGKTTADEERIKAEGNTIISRIGDVMNHEENGRKSFTEDEITNVRGIVANTRLDANGISELLELEKVVQEELESRIQKMAA
jgi:hypothetical protein